MVHTTCAVEGCLSTSQFLNKNLKFHQFPRTEKRCKAWIEACGRPDLIGETPNTTKNTYICSLHFIETMYSKKSLKKTAIPVLHLPFKKKSLIQTRIKQEIDVPKQEKQLKLRYHLGDTHKKPRSPSPCTSNTDEVNPQEENEIECRTCLQKINSDGTFFNIFESWPEYVEGSSETIAKDLGFITKIELDEIDPHSKIICLECYTFLYNVITFTATVKSNDNILKERHKDNQAEEIHLNKLDDNTDKNVSAALRIKVEAVSKNFNSDGRVTTDINKTKVKVEQKETEEPILHLTQVRGVQNLTMSNRNAIILMHEQDVPVSEISKKIGITKETVALLIRKYTTRTIDSLPAPLSTKRGNGTLHVSKCQERIQFASKYKDFDWMNNVVVFTSMTRFLAQDVWFDETINLSYLCWLTSMGPGELVPIKDLAVVEDILDTYENVILPSVRVAYPHEHIYFMHDNASAHSRSLKNWLTSQDNVSVITWPSEFADLNIMHDIWTYIIPNCNLSPGNRTNTCFDKLVHSSWESVRGSGIWWHTITKMGERLEAVIESEGDSINY